MTNTQPWVVGADLGATKIALGLIDPSDAVVATRRIPTDSHLGVVHAAQRMQAAVANALRRLFLGVIDGDLGPEKGFQGHPHAAEHFQQQVGLEEIADALHVRAPSFSKGRSASRP